LKSIKSTKDCLVCIPDIFDKRFSKEIIEETEYDFWKKSKFIFGGLWRKNFGKEYPLGDAFISRFYLRFKDKSRVGSYVDRIKQIWYKRNIVFVEGENSRLGVGNDLFDNAKSIRRILAPSKNAFDKYDEIVDNIRKNVKKDDLIILALGPTASVLAFELSSEFQCLDLGHIDIEYEWFRMGVTTKVPVKNKHVNECNSDGTCEVAELDKKYLKEIIVKIN